MNWDTIFKDEFKKKYMQDLKSFLNNERSIGKKIFPPENEIFAAFDMTPFEKVKVIILGQDPYINYGQAHGLSFSVREGVKIPPSLNNIYKELNIKTNNGCLRKWAIQGVLLLNNILTVEEGRSKSHKKRGWENFTDLIIEKINDNKRNVVFMLWGNDAQEKCKKINKEKHLVLSTSHPSPLSFKKGFCGCKHFDLCNAYLTITMQKPINWWVL